MTLKIIAISDTHLQVDLKDLLQDYFDSEAILIHAGDALNSGSLKDWNQFRQDLRDIRMKFRKVIYVPGNHDRSVEAMTGAIREDCQQLSVDLLIDQELIVDGLRFFGSPYTPQFGNWSFMYPRTTNRWENLPDDIDVFISHGPPYMILDNISPLEQYPQHVGCWDLANYLKRIKPKVSLHAHIHESFGRTVEHGTHFYNVSICNEMYQPLNPVTVIEYDF